MKAGFGGRLPSPWSSGLGPVKAVCTLCDEMMLKSLLSFSIMDMFYSGDMYLTESQSCRSRGVRKQREQGFKAALEHCFA